MDRLRLSRGFWVSAKRISRDDRDLINVALNGLARDFPDLPAAGDIEARMEPARRCFARRLGATALWVFYDLSAEAVHVLAVGPRIPD